MENESILILLVHGLSEAQASLPLCAPLPQHEFKLLRFIEPDRLSFRLILCLLTGRRQGYSNVENVQDHQNPSLRIKNADGGHTGYIAGLSPLNSEQVYLLQVGHV